MSDQLIKRLLTSLFLFIIMYLMFAYTFVLIISLILISIITWIEFYGLVIKIFKKNFYKLLIKILSLVYIILFSFLIFNGVNHDNNHLEILYLLSICICSDIGGLIFGKIFKGKKLTRISPNKTLSGSIGSFILSLLLTPLFMKYSDNFSMEILVLIILLTSLTSQLGDLFISYLKRKAKVKNTGNLLPGHGGVLDRIDGIIFSIPIGFLLFNSF